MCTELKQEKYMRAYVEEAGNTALCSVATGAGCSERESAFIAKVQSGAKEPAAEHARLVAMAEGGKMKPSLLAWLNQRISILEQFDGVGDGAKDEL
jgi:hypothetical protein